MSSQPIVPLCASRSAYASFTAAFCAFFFFNDTATTEIYTSIHTLSLHDALPISVSACMAGVAGALYVPQVGIINPSEFAPANSIEAVIWVAVGGRGTLVGAVIGAILVNYAKTTFTSGI